MKHTTPNTATPEPTQPQPNHYSVMAQIEFSVQATSTAAASVFVENSICNMVGLSGLEPMVRVGQDREELGQANYVYVLNIEIDVERGDEASGC